MSELALKNGGVAEAAAESSARMLAPRVDVLETENEFLLLLDMPGATPQDVDIRFEKGELTVHGRRQECHGQRQAVHRECESTSYQRTFSVAETVAADKITADLKNGVLTVRLPKIEAVKPKKIVVQG